MVAKKIEDTTEPQAKTATKKAASAPQSPAGEAHTAGSGKKPADKKMEESLMKEFANFKI